MGQISFSDAEYAGKRKKTRREVFLEEMEQVVPWKALLGLVEPHYPVAGRGRRPYPLESMLRVHLMQNWFALSDPAMEEALYEIASLRAFAQLSLGEPIPDETTILNRSDRDGDTPVGKLSSMLDVQMGASSANAIRASGLRRLHHRPDIRLQPCLLLQHANRPCDPGGAHIRPSLGVRPHFARHLDHALQLAPLVVDRQRIAMVGAREAALR